MAKHTKATGRKAKTIKIKLHTKYVEPRIKKTKWRVIEGKPVVIIDPSVIKNMKKKEAKKLRKLAEAIGFNKTPQEKKKMYKRFKKIHQENKKNGTK